MDLAPILPPSGSLPGNVHHSQIQHLEEAVVRREYGFRLGHLPKLPDKTLNGIGGVDQPPQFLGILEVGAEVGSVIPPGLGDFGVFLILPFRKGIQRIHGRGLVHRVTDRLQVVHQGLQILVGDIFAGIAQLVDDTVLDFESLFERFPARFCASLNSRKPLFFKGLRSLSTNYIIW